MTPAADQVYACHCERTSVGWHTRGATGTSRQGCFHARREGGASLVAVNNSTSAQAASVKTLAMSSQQGVLSRKRLLRQTGQLRGGGGKLSTEERHDEHAADKKDALALPATWDWRTRPELKQDGDDLANDFDQGACGSCYAFSGVVALSMRFRIALAKKNGKPTDLDLSWRAAVRCSMYTEGCNGGFP